MADRIAQLKAILESEPNDPFCLYGLAMEYAKLGDMQQAIAWFDRTIAADPNDCYAYFHKARCQEQAGDAAGAIATLEAGLARAKSCGDVKAANEIAGYLDQLS